MADKTVILEVKLLEGGAQSKLDALRASIQGLDKTHKDYKPTLELIAKAERDLSKVQQKRILIEKGLISSTNNVDKATKNTSKTLNKQSDATGSATAATMELSRVVSDAPYGIRGMANNITQLVSQLGTASMKAGGLGAAIKLMIKQMMGPLGVVFAITAVVAALDYFKGGMKKAEKSLDGFRVTAAGAASDLTSLLIVMKEGMLSKEELSSVIDKVNEKYKDLNLSISEEGKLTKESITQIDDKIAALGKLAMANAMLSEIQSKRGETAKAASKLQKETSEDLKKLGLESIADFRDSQKQREDETKSDFVKRKNQLIFYKEGEYKGLLDMEKLDRVNSIKRQVASFDETKNRVSSQVKEFLKLATDEGFFEHFFNTKKGKSGDKDTEGRKFVDSLYRELRGIEDLISDEDLAKIEGDLIIKPKVVATKAYDEIAEFIGHYKTLMSGLTDFIDGEFERELTIEQNKTNAINAELNNRLNNENLSKDQRASIQNQIAQNDEKLRVKQEAIARKQFKVTKAFNIAMTIADTYMAAQKAYLSQMTFDPTAPIRAKIAAGIAVAAGLAKVAAISRTQFQTTAPSTPTNVGGGGSIGGRAEPSFNIVGRSNDNILLSAIQSQFDQPLRAYVVARDVTNQQQLDGVISTSAST